MANLADEATKRHQKGYNCAQAVICALSEKLGVDEKTMFTVSEGFGLGNGCMQGVCGALSGAVMAAGIKNSCQDLETPNSKGATYKLSKEITEKFIERVGSCTCKEIKGVETGKVLCSCPDCICKGVEIAEEVLGL
jgi:C_GCAxxG_C_C family probable redox protein